jgi:hypothetical protein
MRPWLLLALLAGCTSPPETYTRLWIEGRTGVPSIGTSTEDGVLVLAQPEWKIGDRFEIQFPIGNSLVVDKGRIDRLNDTVAVIKPLSSRLREGRFAASLPEPGEQLYVALRNELDEPLMAEAEPWKDGAWGDWILLPGRDAAQIAADYAGTGVYVRRDDRWEIVGLLAGLVAQDETAAGDTAALGFIGLGELARILPDHLDFFVRDLRPLRPDFEFGVPLQPGELEPVNEPVGVAPASKPVPVELIPLPTMVPKAGAGGAAGAGAGAAGKAPGKGGKGKPVPKSKQGKAKGKPPGKGTPPPPPRAP